MLQILTLNVINCNKGWWYVYKRFIQENLTSFLKIMPVVLLTGGRQTGKTTLVDYLAQNDGFSYFTFDDDLSLSSATHDPSGWLMGIPKPVIIDEVQRVPEIFLAIKRDVDLNRHPGRYLLTGSANPLLLPKLGDSLAGRMGVVSLFPFSHGELIGKKESFIENLFNEKFSYKESEGVSQDDFIKILLKGGYPPVQDLQNPLDVKRWIGAYLQIMMERDVRDISQIEGLREFPRLFRLLASRSGSLLNMADISRSIGMVNVTLNRYLRLLETLFFIYLLPAWYSNLGKRIVKSPKIYICDTAILANLLEADKQRISSDQILMGQFLENFVFSEILKQKSWSSVNFEMFHFRDGDQEVDFVLEKSDGSIYAIEVKSTKKINSSDLRGLKNLKNIAKDKFKRGIILHFGSQIQSLGEDLFAVPIPFLWN